MKPRSIGLFVTVAIVTLTCSSTSQVQAANITVKGVAATGGSSGHES